MSGVFGVFGHAEAAILSYFGLRALQYRGYESAGIISSDGEHLYEEKIIGEVEEEFTEFQIKRLSGEAAIGYIGSTTQIPTDTQPIKVERLSGSMAVCADGNIVDAFSLRRELEKRGAIFQSRSSDVEVLLHLIGRVEGKTFREKLFEALRKARGAFSLLLLTENELIAARDPFGFRPLCLGQLDGAYILASESCAFDLFGADYIREIEPGEVFVVNKNGQSSHFPFVFFGPYKKSLCFFEWSFLSRPDSRVFANQVASKIKTRLGKELAKEEKIKADVVIDLPDSSRKAALGFAYYSGIRFHADMIRNHDVKRRQPKFPNLSEKIEDFSTKIKYNLVPDVLKDKVVILVVHSLFAGRKIPSTIRMIRAQAKEVHVRVSIPPIESPCHYGVDFPEKDNLIANRCKSIKTIAEAIGADSVRYQSMEGLYRAIGDPTYKDYCYACLTGEYPL